MRGLQFALHTIPNFTAPEDAMSDVNLDIVEKLSHIADAYKSQGAIHKYKAYRTAISTIKSLPSRITSVSDVKGLQGIGKAMEEKIQEILATGGLKQEVNVLADPVTNALQLFTSIHGIGPAMAHKLVHEQGKRTLADLDLSQLPTQAQLGVKYFFDAKKRIPHAEVRTHHCVVERVCKEFVDAGMVVSVCGSHRRGLATSGDVDILLTHPCSRSDASCEYVYLQQVVHALRTVGYICDTLVEGSVKFMGYGRLPQWASQWDSTATAFSPEAFTTARRVDIRWFAYDNFAPALLYFTGSDLMNIQMRQKALELGYTLSEYGVFQNTMASSVADSPGARIGKGPKVPNLFTEEAIFEMLKIPFVPPSGRNK